MSEQDKRERAGEWAKGDAEATRFISLDDVAKPSGDTPAPTATAPRRRLAALAAVAACCAVVLVASLGFVYPAEDGSWSLSWLFATTQEVQDSDSTAASDGAHASDEGAEGASSATDANADGDTADPSADAEGTGNNGQAQSGTATDGSARSRLGRIVTKRCGQRGLFCYGGWSKPWRVFWQYLQLRHVERAGRSAHHHHFGVGELKRGGWIGGIERHLHLCGGGKRPMTRCAPWAFQ